MNKLSIPSFYLLGRRGLIKWIISSLLLISFHDAWTAPKKLFAPVNDNSAGATIVTHASSWCSGLAAYTTVTATSDGARPLNWGTGPNNNVWFKFQATATSVSVEVKTGGTEGTLQRPSVALHDASFTLLRSIAENGKYVDIGVSYDALTIGSWYYINVDNGNLTGETGTFTLCVNTITSNDYPAQAITVPHSANWCSALAAYSTNSGTPNGTKPTRWVNGPNNNVWFKFQATTTAVTVDLKTGDTEGTLRKPKVALHNSTFAELQSVNENGNYTDLSLGYNSLTVGSWYYVNIDNGNDLFDRGTFSLCINTSTTNDVPEGAIVIPHSSNWCSGLAAYNNVSGTPDKVKPANWGDGPFSNVWFKFQATTTAVSVDLKTGGTEGTLQRPKLALYNSSYSELRSINELGTYTDVGLSYEGLTVGSWYYLSVDNGNQSYERGTFTLCINTITTNDYPGQALTIPHSSNWCSALAAYTNAAGTPDRAKPANWGDGPFNNVWFKFQATATSIAVELKTGGTEGTIQRPKLALYNSTYAELRSVNENGQYVDISMSYEGLTVGSWYYVSVDNGNQLYERGTFTLCVNNTSTQDYPSGAVVVSTISNWCSALGAYTTNIGTPDGPRPPNWAEGPFNNVWFKFQATTTSVAIEVKTGGTEGTIRRPKLALHTSAMAVLANVTNIGDEYGDIGLSYEGLSVGSWYFINVDNGNQSYERGTFTLCVDNQATYDYPSHAIELTNLDHYCSVNAAHTTAIGSANGTKPSTWTSGPNNNVWFKFQAITAKATIDLKTGATEGTLQRPMLAVHNSSLSVVSSITDGGTYTDRQLVLTSLTIGAWYYIHVDNGNQSYERGTFTLCIDNALPIPTSLTSEATTPGAVNLAWQYPSANATGFEIERSLNGTSGFSLLASVPSAPLSFTDLTVQGNTTYYYRLRAKNAAGASSYSAVVSQLTLPEILPTPGNLIATAITASSIQLTWTDNTTNESGFEIQRSTSAGGPYTLLTTTAADAISFTDTGLTPVTSYYYRVRAIGTTGTSVYTAEISAATFSDEGNVPDALEFAALKDIYDYMNGLNWNKKANWPQEGEWPETASYHDFKDWQGVTVENGDVVLLDVFQNNNAAGALPASIASLTGLRRLDLMNLDGVGNFPDFSSLVNLEYLAMRPNLGNTNYNSGPLPVWLGTLTKLKSLYLINVNIKGGSIDPILTNLINLNYLSITDSELSGDISNITHLTNLISFDITNNKVTGTLPLSLNMIPGLINFIIANNKIQGVFPATEQLSQLAGIDLHGNQLMGIIPSLAPHYNKLTFLNVSRNAFTSLPTDLGQAIKLGYLNVSHNQLSGSIPDLSSLMSLQTLDFSDNPGLTPGPIPAWLEGKYAIKKIDLSNTNRTGEIPIWLGANSNLENLHLDFNQLTGAIPSGLNNSFRLRELSVSHNLLSVVTQMNKILFYLDISYNKFSGPVSFQNLNNILFLDISNNDFSGEFALTNYRDAYYINLSRNRFNAISSNLGDMGSFYTSPYATNADMITLDLSHNEFTSLPASLWQIVNSSRGENGAHFLFNDNRLTSLPASSGYYYTNTRDVDFKNNFIDWSQLVTLALLPPNINLTPQLVKPTQDEITVEDGGILTIPSSAAGATENVIWRKGNGTEWADVTSSTEDPTFRSYYRASPVPTDAGLYSWTVTNSDVPGVEIQSLPVQVKIQLPATIDELINENKSRVVTIPTQVKIDRSGKIPDAVPGVSPYSLMELNVGVAKEVFANCQTGNYYVGFQLAYDLGDKNTTAEWLSELSFSLMHGQEAIWSGVLQVNSKNQTFTSTDFYALPISCDGTYRVRIDKKINRQQVPQDNISLAVLLFRSDPPVFNPSLAVTLECSPANGYTTLSWTYPGDGATEFDLEWVAFGTYEGTYDAATSFKMKEPARITTSEYRFNHQTFYPDGYIRYRIRAVGYNPLYPGHRITGAWSYSPCDYIAISNVEPQKNWQAETVFAEDGKNKKVVQYFDGTLRVRQSQTNLSTEGVTLTGETLYDFEGRKSVEVLAAPVKDQGNPLIYSNTLSFKPGLNTFLPADAAVIANVTATRKKINYDNERSSNSPLSNADGAANYYSASNTHTSTHQMLIPDGEGFVYSQTEYTSDGTGRVKRQSGVGKKFKIDNSQATQYFYGEAAPAELYRLFGSNVGNASHYKKNLVIDANRQVSVSYLDQNDKIIATALAGEKPGNVEALSSFSGVFPSVNVNLNTKNQRKEGQSVTTHKILNVAPTQYTFTYDLTATNPASLGCPACNMEVTITLTQPNGQLVNLGIIQGNQSPDTYHYIRSDWNAVNCTPNYNQISIALALPEIGDYTLTKKLIIKEAAFEDLKTIVKTNPDIQNKIAEITAAYNDIDYNKCAVCSTQPTLCTDAENAVIDAFNKVAQLDCENIIQQIKADLRAQHPTDYDYEPGDSEIRGDVRYCRYELCIKDKESDVFEKQMAKIESWSDAVFHNFTNPIDIDPFFNKASLSGSGYKNTMSAKTESYFVATVNGINFSASIQNATYPDYAPFFIDANGNKTNNNAVGKHILYMDLMERKSQMTVEAFTSELNVQRWALFKSFYLEAKRQTRLTIPAYTTGCPKAKEELQQMDNLPKTEQGVRDWASGKIITDPVTEEQLDMSLASIKLACNPQGMLIDPDQPQLNVISDVDANFIRSQLRLYFNSKPNFFKIIHKNDLLPGNDPSRIYIQSINSTLSKYGCSLSGVAVDDPAECLNQRQVILSYPDLVFNSKYQNCALLESLPVPDPDCGWTKANGNPAIFGSAESRWATLKATKCSPTSDAIRGVLKSPLVPGKRYKLSLSYRSSENEQQNYSRISKAFLEFTHNPGYSPSYVYDACNQPLQRAAATQSEISQRSSAEPESVNISPNVAFPTPPCNDLEKCCGEPGVALPDYVHRIGGPYGKNAWEINNVPGNHEWINETVSFIASDASTNFVISLVNKQNVYSCKINTWGTAGTYENQLDESYLNHFAGLNNAYGNIVPQEGRGNSYNALAIQLNTPPLPCPGPGCPDPCPGPNCPDPCPPRSPGDVPCEVARTVSSASTQSAVPANQTLAYLDAHDEYGVNSYLVSVWVKTPNNNAISSNTQRILYLDVEDPTIFPMRNFVTLQSTVNTWQKLEITFYTHLPSRIVLRSDIEDSEVLPGGQLLLDDYSVVHFLGVSEESMDIKDVSIIEDGVSDIQFTFCDKYATPDNPDYLTQYTTRCTQNLLQEAAVLRERAIDVYLENEITNYSNNYQSKCMEGAQENLTYQFTPKEYHHTLYYYDQAGNLAQTVPPEGVKPLDGVQSSSLPGNVIYPQHELITRYQYNTLNQLIWQSTPDAGESRFWYDDKSRLRLSQNAQQHIDSKYSYTKYDKQGRITEVGEMLASDPVASLTARMADSSFPQVQYADTENPLPDTYLLNDITRTHYDFADTRAKWINISNVTVSDNALTSITGNYWEDRAFTSNYIPEGHDGYIEFRPGTAGSDFVMGLSDEDGETYYTIDYGILLQAGNAWIAENNNGGQSPKTTYQLTDVFRVERKGTTINYLKNGEVFYTSQSASTATLHGDCNFNTSGSKVINIAMEAFAKKGENNSAALIQQNLRSRVAWVEVMDQMLQQPMPAIETHYSYDIHGNVRSLTQQLPGLKDKRTDYIYDLVSGKVNKVLYQFGESDQFYHYYEYDADNRITKVSTSSDGFIKNKEVTYQYYLHGPLARSELGEHRVQGLDYYYTLQGWLKGVNSPTGPAAQVNDPMQDGRATSMVGKDAMAYNLGYYEGDYKPIVPEISTVLIEVAASQLWVGTRNETLGLYNGNIAWMATDLAQIGINNNDRITGLQAMQYTYDQLNRLTRSRSRTFTGTDDPWLTYRSGGNNGAYDEDYSYDANGNLLTLWRNNKEGGLKDNFHYTYYESTNRLKGVKPVEEDMMYSQGQPITSNNKLYRNITVQDNAYIPDGEDVTLRATENIYLHPQFSKARAKSFRAMITDEGVYQYDAIGNLIIDRKEGSKISWTPYGKVREVKTKGDSVRIHYRYDAAGNHRIEKKVTTLTDEGTIVVKTIFYERDASGNVMAVYNVENNIAILSEQPIYGSSRIGQYRGGTHEGQETLGNRYYELANHLGNVLTVVTDNISMSTTDGVYATVVSAADYYPFGLEMEGRAYNSDDYHYGFNGKEKDKFNATVYDYGFRIYDPETAKFLSLDPMEKSFPWNSPYSYAENDPISCIDLDGLEKVKKTNVVTSFMKGTKDGVLALTQDVKSVFTRETYNSIKNNASDAVALYTGAPGGAKRTSAFWVRFSLNAGYGITNTINQPINFVMTMPQRSANQNAYLIGYGTGYYGTMYAVSELFSGLSVGAVASRSKTFYTVQGSDDAFRLLNGGKPWPTAANRAALGEGVYAWDNLASARSYQALRTSRGIDTDILTFDVTEFNLKKFKSIDVDALADPDAFLNSASKLYGGDANHGFQYIKRGTNYGTENFFSKDVMPALNFRKRK